MNQKIKNATGLYLEGIRDGHYREAVEKYTGDRYTQHSTGVKDGKEGFIEFFSEFVKRNPERDIQVRRALVDGNKVFLHVYQDIGRGQAQWVTTDFFDFDENDRIVEHWDVIAPYVASTPSGHTSVDGPTEVVDRDKTEANKALVKELMHNALMRGGDPGDLSKYINKDKYIQHNKEVADGLAYFQELATTPNRPLNYEEIMLMVGEGNFVAALSRANWNDGKIDQDYAQVDLFRIDDGLIVEHWDNVEPVPETSVNSGKF